MADYGREVSDDPMDIWNWRTLDLAAGAGAVGAPGGPVPPERVHVLPLPGPEAPREEIWHRFAGLLGLDPDAYDLSGTSPTSRWASSRRRRCAGSTRTSARSRRRSTRASTSAPTWPTSGWCRAAGSGSGPATTRSRSAASAGGRAVELVRRARLRRGRRRSTTCWCPTGCPSAGTRDSVTDAEVAGVATELVATMLDDVRRCRHERTGCSREVERRRSRAVADAGGPRS